MPFVKKKKEKKNANKLSCSFLEKKEEEARGRVESRAERKVGRCGDYSGFGAHWFDCSGFGD